MSVPDPTPGEVLVRNLYMSVDPYMRRRMNEGKSYEPQFEIGKPLERGAVGRMIASKDEQLPVMHGCRVIAGAKADLLLDRLQRHPEGV